LGAKLRILSKESMTFNASLRVPDQIKVPTIEVNRISNPFENNQKPPRHHWKDSFSGATTALVDTTWQQFTVKLNLIKESTTNVIEPEPVSQIITANLGRQSATLSSTQNWCNCSHDTL